jgi:crotonobetainyl-CoA:carnitine CoA-transferase CaiB-like acyl-CoA transferase
MPRVIIMRPLDGIRVIDLTRVVSGPYCTMQLGDLGAEVIKIERPSEGDDTRAFAPPYQGDQAAYFLSINRNKKSVTLDLKTSAGKEILWKLIDGADVLVENFRRGTLERLGFGYDRVHARRAELVYASISGFGDSGPERDRAGYDVIVQGEAGIMDLTGPHDGAPHKVGTPIADLASGLTMTQGILAALLVRQTTGMGQYVHVSMYEAVASLLTFTASIYFATGSAPRRRGNEHPTIVPYETFEAADGWLNLGIANDDHWRRFCEATDRSDLAEDRRFTKAADRVRHRDILVPIVRDIVHRRTRDQWRACLDARGIPCGAIRNVGEVCDGEVLRARGMIAEMAHPTAGVVKGIKSPVQMSDIADAAERAHKVGAILCVDSSVAPPVTTRPLELGADIVFHSASKYLNGHSDVLAGVLITRQQDERWRDISLIRDLSGGVLGSFEAWLLMRGLRTLFIRFEKSSENALEIARHFSGHPLVERVLYPGLESHPRHAVAKRQMSNGFGGMMSLCVKGDAADARKVAASLQVFLIGASLGGVESLVEHRASVEGADSVVPTNLLRFSVGIEPARELIQDLEQALSTLGR